MQREFGEVLNGKERKNEIWGKLVIIKWKFGEIWNLKSWAGIQEGQRKWIRKYEKSVICHRHSLLLMGFLP